MLAIYGLATYSTAQFKLDRTSVQHGLDMTCFSVHTHASKIDDVKPTVQSPHVHTRGVHDSLQMHTCMSGMYMPNLDYTCM